MKQYTQLSQEERYTITALLRRHIRIEDIAVQTGRHKLNIPLETCHPFRP